MNRSAEVVAFEIAVVSFFVDAADLLGVPKSVAAIYGLCFSSAEPLSFADLDDRLDISTGSISQPVKIVDLARQMIELSGLRVDEDIEIKFVGLKPGEKLYEELQHHSEDYATTTHPRIMRLVSQLSVEKASRAAMAEEERLAGLENNELKKLLKQLVPEYTPFLD